MIYLLCTLYLILDLPHRKRPANNRLLSCLLWTTRPAEDRREAWYVPCYQIDQEPDEPIQASFLRQIVAGPRSRHSETGLDLCYVTDNSELLTTLNACNNAQQIR